MIGLLAIVVAAGASAPNVVLISMDTTRADVLSCYGALAQPSRAAYPTTPRIDAVAEAGIRFERFYANSPSTLSSHTTMFTGLDPHGHGVVRNGYPVDPALPTLAERLSAAGWDTIAVVGAAALESAMGLNRGFRAYDDDTPVLHGLMYQDRASHVVERALSQVDARPAGGAPVFLFVHFYDPHTPYDPPRAYRDRFVNPDYRGSASAHGEGFKQLAQATRQGRSSSIDQQHLGELYVAEVAYMDAQIGVLLDGLEARGLLDHAVVMITADHGETLVDEPTYAWSHGSNVAHEVMWVPLIVQGRGLPLAEHATVARMASMDGLARTLERIVGLDASLGTGMEFYDAVRAGPTFDRDGWPDRPTTTIYMEATRPRGEEATTGWNNRTLHRGVWAGGWGAWRAPFLGISMVPYDHGRVFTPGVLPTLSQVLARWDAHLPPHRQVDMPRATRRALEALGYLDDAGD